MELRIPSASPSLTIEARKFVNNSLFFNFQRYDLRAVTEIHSRTARNYWNETRSGKNAQLQKHHTCTERKVKKIFVTLTANVCFELFLLRLMFLGLCLNIQNFATRYSYRSAALSWIHYPWKYLCFNQCASRLDFVPDSRLCRTQATLNSLIMNELASDAMYQFCCYLHELLLCSNHLQ